MTDNDTDDDEYTPEYEFETFVLSPNIKFEILSLQPPPIEYMSILHTQKHEISGRQVWCGSMLLAKYFLTQLPLKRNILELGSGTGLLGMTLSKLCAATKIVITDGDDDAIELMKRNLIQNELLSSNNNIEIQKLVWGQDNNDLTLSSFDMIVAGDVLYKEILPPLFFATVNEYLSADGVLWLCHIPRAGMDHERVRRFAQDAGFGVEEVPSDHLT
eukprot:CAMPEP_0119564760 /NCGR_PEP_ID=MMETSP1352-20130426/27977_1 /TAXON_ID=265584 /ORGANISM="Stauroneis constricta, Strain CCMP1120" /LENGTH=215 /DNA_ID=CAMNT_0007613547 /DNA_START=57 /DNA_END=701 /DNA_ORIENTATION=-